MRYYTLAVLSLATVVTAQASYYSQFNARDVDEYDDSLNVGNQLSRREIDEHLDLFARSIENLNVHARDIRDGSDVDLDLMQRDLEDFEVLLQRRGFLRKLFKGAKKLLGFGRRDLEALELELARRQVGYEQQDDSLDDVYARDLLDESHDDPEIFTRSDDEFDSFYDY